VIDPASGKVQSGAKSALRFAPRSGIYRALHDLGPSLMTDDTEALLSLTDVLALLNVSRRTFFYMIKDGDFPPHTHKLRQAHRWQRAIVMEWLDTQRVSR